MGSARPSSQGNSLMSRRWWLPLCILALAFALRMWRLDLVLHSYDYGAPHGLGIAILEAIQDGRWHDLPLLNFPTGVGLRNPVGISYVWAVVALFDRSPYSATVLSVLLNVAGVAAVFALAKRMGGARAGAIAAFLMAASPWSIVFARGTWMQGQLEAFGAIAALLVWVGLSKRKARRLLGGLALTAMFAQTYLTAFGLIAQAGIASLWAYARGMPRALRGAAGLGMALCALSVVAYAAVIIARPDSGLAGIGRYADRSLKAPVSFPNPFGLHLDRAPIENALGLVSGRAIVDDESDAGTLASGAAPLFSSVIEALVAIGVLACIARFRRDPARRIALLWFAVPVLAATAAGIRLPLVGFGARQYMLLTAPAGYFLAALGATALLDRVSSGRWFRGLVAGLTLAGLAWAALAGARVAAAGEQQARSLTDPMVQGDIALRFQPGFAEAWRSACARSANPQNPAWQASMLGAERPIQQARAQFSRGTVAWQIGPGGGDCVTITDPDLAPPFSELADRRPADGKPVLTFRSRAVADEGRLLAGAGVDRLAMPLPSNIGWTLIGDRVASPAGRGLPFRFGQVWRIDALPQLAHENVYYTLFVKLVDASGRRFELARSVEDGPLPPGKWWAVGEYILSWQALEIPADAAPGPARLEVSLYDAGQKQNAAYFDPAQAGKVIVVREIALLVQ